MKIDTFHFSKWLHRVERTQKHLEKLVRSRFHKNLRAQNHYKIFEVYKITTKFLKSTIFKKQIGKKYFHIFKVQVLDNTFCVVFSMKKPFSPNKIGRFLRKKNVKNVFFCKFVKKQ